MVTDGNKILRECGAINDKHQYEECRHNHQEWRSSCGQQLKQLFTEKSISDDFLKVGALVISETNRTLENYILDLQEDITDDLNNLSKIEDDVFTDLYTTQPSSFKVEVWKAAAAAIITAIASIITTIIVSPPKDPSAKAMQGLQDLSLNGKWLYVCTDYNGFYQHGGTFTVTTLSDGALQLNGLRMWKDTYDTVNKVWSCKTFTSEKILPWYSTWIYVHARNQFNMEYEITVDGQIVKGYCTGSIKEGNAEVQKIEGYFYQLLPRIPLLAGRVTFNKVGDSEYFHPVWERKSRLYGNRLDISKTEDLSIPILSK